MDIVIGAPDHHCIVTLVERVTGATLLGKLRYRRAADVNRRVIELIEAHPELFLTITVDNGPEFHSYKEIEDATAVTVYFADPTLRGSAERTRTPTGSFASTC